MFRTTIKFIATAALALLLALPAYAGITEVAILNLLTGADTDITTTNFAPQVALVTQLDGIIIVKVCVVWTDGLLAPLDGSVYLFDADPTLAANDATLTVAEALTVVARFDFTTENFQTQFATASVACQDVESPVHTITHVAWHHSDGGTLTNEAIDLHFWFK